MEAGLKIITYPDPRLRKTSANVEAFDEKLADLAKRMFELMREAGGVGLAAPQVGINLRIFVSNHTGKPEDDRVYINPELFDAEGEETAEEGCLSLPGIKTDVLRAKHVRLLAKDLKGHIFEAKEEGYLPRIWQHEFDHLNGTMIIDRMGPTARMEARKTLKEMEDKYAEANPAPVAAKKSVAPRRRGRKE